MLLRYRYYRKPKPLPPRQQQIGQCCQPRPRTVVLDHGWQPGHPKPVLLLAPPERMSTLGTDGGLSDIDLILHPAVCGFEQRAAFPYFPGRSATWNSETLSAICRQFRDSLIPQG